jgi:hypothetical protein
MLHRIPFLAAALLVILAAGPTLAQPQKKAAPQAESKEAPKDQGKKEPPQPQRLGGEKAWNAYSLAEAKGKICYVVGDPAKKEPSALKRERVNALVTHNTADKTSNVVSFVAGAPFAERSDAELDVDGKKFSLFTDKDTAWARDTATDKAVVAALAKGKQATMKGTPARGGGSMTDTYSLAGFGQALALADKACGIKDREPAKTAETPKKKEAAPAKKQ